jgi:hypothetical protein
MSIVRFLAVVFAALALVPAAAHLIELPHKIGLTGSDYLIVQRLYRGWNMAGIVVIGALLLMAALAYQLRGRQPAFGFALFALLCIAGTQIIFWTFTFPVNRETSNWTVLPANWIALRSRWEYSHAASAVLNILALLSATAASISAETA